MESAPYAARLMELATAHKESTRTHCMGLSLCLNLSDPSGGWLRIPGGENTDGETHAIVRRKARPKLTQQPAGYNQYG
jgi:hypothetical protein